MTVLPSADVSGSDDVLHEPPTFGLKTTKMNGGNDFVLIPQPSDDEDDPLNWPMSKKLIIFACVCLAGFAGQMSPNSNQLTFMLQVPNYANRAEADLLNTVAASLAGWMVGPFIFTPLAGIVGRSSVIFWTLIGVFACQIWAAQMTGPNDFIAFAISRHICGLLGGVPPILGAGYIMDMFFLHQRGKAFAIYEALIIFAVVGGGTIGGFIAQTKPWNYVFWWTLGPVSAAIIAVFVFVEDTTYIRNPSAVKRAPMPTNWLANRVATFFPGSKTQPSGRVAEFKRRVIIPFQITITPVVLLVGTFTFIFFGMPIMQASTFAIYLIPPTASGGYGFSSLRLAFFTMTAWVGIISAQIFGCLLNDSLPVHIARRRLGVWHPEYRLANTLLPGVLLPVGLGLYAVGLQLHLHVMVLALSSFLVFFAAMLALPVCYNYIVECFLDTPVEAFVALNSYRIAFGLILVFIVTQWQGAVGVGWMWGMCSLFTLLVDGLMAIVVMKGHLIRSWTRRINGGIAVTEEGERIIRDRVDATEDGRKSAGETSHKEEMSI